MSSLGQRIKVTRQAKRLTRSELAESIGVCTKVIADYEHDKVKEPRTSILINIANALDTNLDYFMCYLRTPLLDVKELNNQLYSVIESLNEGNRVTLLSIAKSLKSQQKTPEKLKELKIGKQMLIDSNQY
jgi:transcriptional regulator with XRE-family HTH domain